MNDLSDSKYFSQRAKHISLLTEQNSPVSSSSTTEVYFRFSNRIYIPSKEISTTSSQCDRQQSISVGRGRTTVPLSAFILQKETVTASESMHNDMQFIQPCFESRNNNNHTKSSSNKREVLLSALKQIESGLKIL